jgi:uncharacterized membrane protein YjgN (DUF898 family)
MAASCVFVTLATLGMECIAKTLMNAAMIQTITAHHWQNVQILLEALLVTVFQHILAMGLFVMMLMSVCSIVTTVMREQDVTIPLDPFFASVA